MGKRMMVLAMISVVLSMCLVPGMGSKEARGKEATFASENNEFATDVIRERKAWEPPCEVDEDTVSGSAVMFEFDEETGTLTFTGEGEIHDNYSVYEEGKAPAWYKHVKEVKHLVIGDGITRIGVAAFYEFPHLKDLTISDTVTQIDTWAFRYCFELEGVKLPKNLISLGHEAFRGCLFLKKLTLPEGLKELGSVSYCFSLKEIVVPESVTRFDSKLFSGCIRLKDIKLPDTMKQIKKYDFADCVDLRTLKIPKTVTSVCMSAFASCGLRVIDLPKNVTKIKNGDVGLPVFVKKQYSTGNRWLRTIILRSKKIRSIQKNSFSGLKKRVVIKVPKQKLNEYRAMLYKSGMSKKNKVRVI